MSHFVPRYRRHPNGQAFVQHRSIPTDDHRLYLGSHGSPQSQRRYQQFLARLLTDQQTSPPPGCWDRSLDELIALYLHFAETYYSHQGQTCKEFSSMVEALRPVSELFGDQDGGEFGPRCLTTIQRLLVSRSYARKVINNRVSRVKRFIRWCCKNEHLPPERYQALMSVDGLRRGRSGAKESEPVRPVPREHMEALLPFVSPPVAAMIQVQFLCGMRPGEVTIMRRCDLDTSGEIWLYRPQEHKGSWREHALVKAIPRAAQQIIRPLFKPNLEAFLFSPKDAEAWRYQNRPPYAGQTRKTPLYACELKQRALTKQARRLAAAKRPKRDHYDTDSYRRAIAYGFQRAEKAKVEIPRWHPNQLRHSIATEISQMLGQQAAQRWLGHVNLKTTDIYVEKQVQELIAIAQELDRRWAS